MLAAASSIRTADIPLDRLAGSQSLTEREKIAEASRQFEAVLLRQILAASQKTVIHSKLTEESAATGIYRDMATTQLADSISRSGAFGLARLFENQLAPKDPPPAGPASRPAPGRDESASPP